MPSLGNDLALIRKHRGLSLEDVRNATKIPAHILSSIEDDSLFSDMEEHNTYVRSYVRSYAKAVKIDEETIVRALDQLEEDRYQGLLREETEGVKGPRFQLDEEERRSGKTEEGQTEESTDSADRTGKKASEAEGERPDEVPDKKAEGKDKGGDMVHDHSPAAMEGKTGESGDESPEPAASGEPPRVPPPPDVSSVDWADLGKKFKPLRTRPRIWIGASAVLLVLAAAALYFVFGMRGSAGQETVPPDPAADRQQQMDLAPDSLQMELSRDNPTGSVDSAAGRMGALQQQAETLPDTLTLAIYAAYGQLEPVRVQSDLMTGINPYWIEEGTAFSFEFTESIRIRGQYERMELLLNGRPIPDFRSSFYNPDTRMLEISRSYFEDDPVWLRPPPDSLAMDAPPPRNIRERPTFN